jgi:hypothetical protein
LGVTLVKPPTMSEPLQPVSDTLATGQAFNEEWGESDEFQK